jgi:hypothetical protein
LAGVAATGLAFGMVLLASDGQTDNGIDDVVGAMLVGTLFVGFAVFVTWSRFDASIPIPQQVRWVSVVAAAAGLMFALLRGWNAGQVAGAVLGSAFLAGCTAWSIDATIAETRQRTRGQLSPVGEPVAVAGTKIASWERRSAARIVDLSGVYLAACVGETLQRGSDANGFLTTSWWLFGGAAVLYEIASLAVGGSPGKRLCGLRVVPIGLGASTADWPRVGIVRAVKRTLLLPVGLVNIVIGKLGVNVLHRINPRLDLVEGSGAGTVVMPNDEVARLRVLNPNERTALLTALDRELRRPSKAVSRKRRKVLLVLLVAAAAGAVLGVLSGDDEPSPPSVTVPTMPTLPLPSGPIVTPTGPTVPSVSIRAVP